MKRIPLQNLWMVSMSYMYVYVAYLILLEHQLLKRLAKRCQREATEQLLRKLSKTWRAQSRRLGKQDLMNLVIVNWVLYGFVSSVDLMTRTSSKRPKTLLAELFNYQPLEPENEALFW